MKRLSFRMLVVLAVSAFGLAGPAKAQQEGRIASYVISVGGLNIASVDIRLILEGTGYQLDLAADVTGLAQVVAQGSGNVNSGGAITATGLQSNRFFLETRTQSERFTLQTGYQNGTATGASVAPPLEDIPGRVPVTAAHRSGVNDPLAAFILRGPALDGALCNRTLRIYTGIERFDMALSFAETQTATSTRTAYQGPVVLCAMRYVPIAGHFETSDITSYLANSNRMLAWFMPLEGTDIFIPYRVLMGSAFGDISMVLVGLQ